MKIRLAPGAALSAGLFLAAAAGAAAQEGVPRPLPRGAVQSTVPSGRLEPIRVVHEGTSRTPSGRMVFWGNVEITYRGAVLLADRVELDPATKDVAAEGRVTLQLPSEVVRASRLFYNLDLGVGRLEDVSGMIQPTVFYRADSAEKRGDDTYDLRRAALTSCAQATPRWSLSASRAELRTDEEVRMWNAVFRIKSVPVFYMPYMSYPLNQDRATGFLFPQVGYSGAKGVTLSESFFWAIARNIDATATVDSYSAKGTGMGVELRYLFRDGTRGTANLYGFKFSKAGSGSGIAENASVVRIQHSQRLPAGFSLSANIDTTSSYEFLREFDNDFRKAVMTNRRSEVYVSRAWDNAVLSVRASQFETYFSGLDNSILSRQLPQVTFSVFRSPVLGPVFFSLTSGYGNWQYGLKSQYEKDANRSSSQLTLSPTLSLPVSLAPWLSLDTQVTENFTYYGSSYLPNSQAVSDEPLFVAAEMAEASLRGPTFLRIYSKDGAAWLKHVIEPFVEYRYDSPVAESARIITPRGFFRYHQVSYGVTNSFLVRSGGMPVEAVRFTLSQVYYFSPEDSPLSRYQVNGRIPRYSEVLASVRVRPAGRAGLDLNLGWNPYYRELASINLRGNVGGPRDPFFLSVSWYKSANSWDREVDPNLDVRRHEIALTGGLRLPRAGLDLMADVAVNLARTATPALVEKSPFRYAAAQVVYHWQCLDLGLEVRSYPFRGETQVKFNLGLGNIGKSTDFLGGFRL